MNSGERDKTYKITVSAPRDIDILRELIQSDSAIDSGQIGRHLGISRNNTIGRINSLRRKLGEDVIVSEGRLNQEIRLGEINGLSINLGKAKGRVERHKFLKDDDEI